MLDIRIPERCSSRSFDWFRRFCVDHHFAINVMHVYNGVATAINIKKLTDKFVHQVLLLPFLNHAAKNLNAARLRP